MEDPAPGVWRLAVRRLGGSLPDMGLVHDVSPSEVDVLAELAAGGSLTAVVAGRVGNPGLGVWRLAGPGRVVLVVEWFVVTAAGGADGRLVVRGAAELSADGHRCAVRLRGRRLTRDGHPVDQAVQGEATGVRLEP